MHKTKIYLLIYYDRLLKKDKFVCNKSMSENIKTIKLFKLGIS